MYKVENTTHYNKEDCKMVKLSITEKYRAETREEAEDFIRAQREKGAKEGYEVTEAKYVHKEKRAKGETVDQAELVTITKVFCTLWDVE